MSKDPNFIDDLLEGVKSNQISIDEAKPNSVTMTNWALLK